MGVCARRDLLKYFSQTANVWNTMAAKKTASSPAKTAAELPQRKPLSKSWGTSDDALTFMLTADAGGQEVIVEDDTDGGSIELAVEIDQIDETIRILTEIKNDLVRYRRGEDVPSDPVDEDDEEDDDEEDDDEDGDG